MKSSVSSSLGRLLATFAMVMQLLLQVAHVAAATTDDQALSFICAAHGELSAEARAAEQRLNALINEAPSQRDPVQEHCPLCTLSVATTLADPDNLSLPNRQALELAFQAKPRGGLVPSDGPPIGSRGPPLSL